MMWAALVMDSDGVIAKVIADIVVATAEAPASTIDDLADRAVLRAYVESIVPDPDDARGTALDAALGKLDPTRPSLFGGVARLGWTIAHLVEDANEACSAIDTAIRRGLDRDLGFDLISGLVGIGVYTLERGAAGAPLAELVLSRLERLAQPRGSGIAWKTPCIHMPSWQREEAPHGHWNLGVAHGTPGVIALLARFAARGMSRAHALLDNAVTFLLEAEPRSTAGRFPSWQLEGNAPAGGTPRLAWCYGDLGVAIALISAARARERADWYQEAILLAHACAERPPEISGVRDAGLCHGAAGAAHLFNRLYRATNDAIFADAARSWTWRLLAMRNSEPYAGFPAAEGGGERLAWSADASLLTGAPGVALALASVITDTEPSWDRLLLADI